MAPMPELDDPAAERFAAPPDPGLAVTLDDLVNKLRLLKVWAGDPSYERIKARINAAWRAVGRPAGELAGKTTVVSCFRPGRRRINADLLIAVVEALHPDEGYVAQWRQALRVIGGEIEAAAQVRVQDTLPPDLAEFTGRTPELDRLREALHHAQAGGGAVVISAIEGMAGVGKTQLAVHAGHLLARERPLDRVLFVNLRGFHPDPAQPPADPAAVLDGFLRLLGLPGQQIPRDLAARTAAYRARLAGTTALVVLDNAADVEQVRPLLAGTPGCLTLVTSRRSLADLQPATRLAVDVFAPEEAVAFLTRAMPEVPVGADPNAPGRIAGRCGYLPLALGLVAGHIRGTPGWTLTDHADRLDERHHHRQLDSGVQLALDLSYQNLAADQQRLLRLAALHPGQDFDAHAVAALTGTDLPGTEDILRHLCRDHLLQQATPGRYSFHDLVRAYAAQRAIDEDRPSARHTALTRLFDFYLAIAATAMDVAYPHERHRRPTVAPAGAATPNLADRGGADRWLDTELSNLLAAAQHAATHGWHEHTWQLSAVLDRHLLTRSRYQDAQTLHQHALHLAGQLGNHLAEANALNGLGYVHRVLGHYAKASHHYERALQIAQDIGDRVGELNALYGHGHVHWMLGRHEPAGDYYERALRIARAIGDRAGELNVLNGLATVHWMLGRQEQAGDHYGQALQLAQAIGDRAGELSARCSLGYVHHMQGRHEQAVGHFEQAWRVDHTIGYRSGELSALYGLGNVHRRLSRHDQAAIFYQQVLDLARELGSGNWQFEALQGLGRLHHATGHPDLALVHHQQALEIATDLAQPTDQARAHEGLAQAHHALGRHEHARHHWQHALDILIRLGVNRTDETRTSVSDIRHRLAELPRNQAASMAPPEEERGVPPVRGMSSIGK